MIDSVYYNIFMKGFVVHQLNDDVTLFPNPLEAVDEGLLAVGGDLSEERLLNAYSRGIFPWYGQDDPILWWSPNPRLIMYLDDFKLTKSLARVIRNSGYEVRIDTNFEAVMRGCMDSPRGEQEGTWISEEIIEAYVRLHEDGYAHSFETYLDGELIGGLYGVSIGRVFCGESMFANKSNASKVAYATLIEYLKNADYSFIDCQVPTNHLKSLGAVEVSREEFLKMLAENV